MISETQSELIELEVMPDHVHLLVEVDPQFGIHKLVKLAGEILAISETVPLAQIGCPRSGPTRISSPPSAVPRWR